MRLLAIGLQFEEITKPFILLETILLRAATLLEKDERLAVKVVKFVLNSLLYVKRAFSWSLKLL